MKVLIIGGGAVSDMFHIPASLELLGKEQVFLAEPNPVQRKKIKDKYDLLHTTEDYHDFLEQADIAVVATPPHAHLEIIRSCMEAGLHVLCEKPLALTPAECQHLLTLQQEKNLVAGMCHTYRFFPNRRQLREQVMGGFFGDDLHLSIEEGEPASWESVSGYNFRKELVPGGVFLDAGIHSLDFILWCMGKPYAFHYEDDSLGGLESNLRLELIFENAVKASFQLSRTCHLSNKIIATGKGKRAELDIFNMLASDTGNGPQEIKTEETYDWTTIAVIQLRDFIRAVETGSSPMCSLEEGAALIELITECYELKKQRPLPHLAPLPGITF